MQTVRILHLMGNIIPVCHYIFHVSIALMDRFFQKYMVSNIAEKSCSWSISLSFSNFDQIYSLVVQAATDLSSLAKYDILVYYIKSFLICFDRYLCCTNILSNKQG